MESFLDSFYVFMNIALVVSLVILFIFASYSAIALIEKVLEPKNIN